MITESSFEEALPILRAKWPEKDNIHQIDNCLGIMAWTIDEITNTSPKWWIYHQDGQAVATMGIFMADKDKACLRAFASVRPISNREWLDLFSQVRIYVAQQNIRWMYVAFKEEERETIRYLGFNNFLGPVLTDDWWLLSAWKDLENRNRFGDQYIADDVDGIGNPIKIWYSETVGGCRAAWLIAKVYSELLEKDWSGPYANFQDIYKNCNVVYSTDTDDNILGGMVFEYRQAGREGFQHLNFTDPRYRGRRISSISRKYHRLMIKAKGGNKIASTIMVNNAPSMKTALRDDMKPVYVRMHKWLV